MVEPGNAENKSLLELASKELKRRKQGRVLLKTLRNTLCVLIVVAAVSVLFSTLWFPVFQVYNNSMEPSLTEGQIVMAVKQSRFQAGDIIAFYFNNKILLKRVVAQGGDQVSIDETGDVFVNDVLLEEPYLQGAKSPGETDLVYPYRVPDNRYFVMGDQRDVSADSRVNMIGTISPEQIIGKVAFCLWPLGKFGSI